MEGGGVGWVGGVGGLGYKGQKTRGRLGQQNEITSRPTYWPIRLLCEGQMWKEEWMKAREGKKDYVCIYIYKGRENEREGYDGVARYVPCG